jgi:rare lipoprotein A
MNKWTLLAYFSITVLAHFSGTALLAQKKTTDNKPSTRVLTGIASFYSDYFNGRKTASGETFRQTGMTCASNNVGLGNWIKVTNLKNNKSVIVKVNDRMAPSMARKGRVVDLTRSAAAQLGFIGAGLTRVKVEVLGKTRPK